MVVESSTGDDGTFGDVDSFCKFFGDGCGGLFGDFGDCFAMIAEVCINANCLVGDGECVGDLGD